MNQESSQAVCAAFCEHLYRLPFELFSQDWKAAAVAINDAGVSADAFMRAIADQASGSWVDPSDLPEPAMLATFRKGQEQADQGAIFAHTQSAQVAARNMRGSGPEDEWDVLLDFNPVQTMITPSYRIIRAMELGINTIPDERLGSRFFDVYGPLALQELESSEALCAHIDGSHRVSSADAMYVLRHYLTVGDQDV